MIALILAASLTGPITIANTICHTREWRPGDACEHNIPMIGEAFYERCMAYPSPDGVSLHINRAHQPAVYQCWDGLEKRVLFSGGVDERIKPSPSGECEPIVTRCETK